MEEQHKDDELKDEDLFDRASNGGELSPVRVEEDWIKDIKNETRNSIPKLDLRFSYSV